MKFILLIVIIAAVVVAARTLMSSQRPSAPPASEGGRVKADEATKTYHTSDSPDFEHLPSEVWFESEESAQTSGFTRWDQVR